MADFPALPLWTDAYLADTRHLSTQQHGAYLLLLMEAWRRPSCSLPDDDILLARLTGLSVDQWKQEKAVVLSLWKMDGRSHEWTQKRLLKERQYTSKNSKSQRDKSLKRWKGAKKDDAAGYAAGYAEPHAEAMPDGMPNASRKVSRSDAPTPTYINNNLITTEPRANPNAPPKDDDGRDLNELHRRLITAAGTALDRTSVKLEIMTIPSMWLDEGADLERDILPTIRDAAPRATSKIQSWHYFTDPIRQAVNRRKQRNGELTASKDPKLDAFGTPRPEYLDLAAWKAWASYGKRQGCWTPDMPYPKLMPAELLDADPELKAMVEPYLAHCEAQKTGT